MALISQVFFYKYKNATLYPLLISVNPYLAGKHEGAVTTNNRQEDFLSCLIRIRCRIKFWWSAWGAGRPEEPPARRRWTPCSPQGSSPSLE
jgi:hypothetical protein